MRYYTHNLRANLQEWRNRLYRSTTQNYNNNHNFFMSKLETVPLLKSMIQEAIAVHPLEAATLKKFSIDLQYGRKSFTFENEYDAASSCYQLINYLTSERKLDPDDIYQNYGYGRTFDEQRTAFIENFIDPIVTFLHDQIDDANYTLHLLEKYKSRVEWFTRGSLVEQYRRDNAEKYLEDDLRLFLFDQGIDYPFSTPRSASGRADIVDLSNPDDPLVLEVKIFDLERSYRKNRIIDGFAQIVKYSNDYNKSIGYLVVFNVDNIEIDIVGSSPKTQPKSVVFNHKTYFIIVINLNLDVTASKLGKLRIESITEEELTQKVI
jgi:hypothetical protein